MRSPGSQFRPVGDYNNRLPEVWLPNPPSKKGTSAYAEWAKACFKELVKHGYNYSQAAEKLGYNGYKAWERWSKADEAWADEVRAIRDHGVQSLESPDLT